ncbi:hypothetical protein EXIGLDRAFT_615876 [Exidia glandulosa HHB12029]|uniref:Uncharacterized protein n=1 Tax=Exidia glandulosa HHB12029 TaxID=1314781 RepID=A0A165H063_EXIGL|nr:hypothetical protein EXIGLDRAFT_615876 [Exidia glandulosa HHB12029]
MQEIALEQPRSVSSRTFSVADGSSVTNWRVAKSAYYNSSFTLPTKIRGLWTRQLPRSSDDEEHSWEIVARGYDKFYEVDEVSWLSWDSIYHNTVGPHYVTIKSNGSLVLISALTPQKLLVTSKNSVGRNASRLVSHSMKAEEWLETHLNAVGKSPRELAFLLWRQNWSLVCELCDDSFEEHVLEVPVESSGLHLHGINKRQVVFCTECPDVVHAFALEWGFFPTPYETFDDMLSVNAYISDLTSPGKWKGPPIEGFVVRTKVAPVANTPDARSLEHPVPRIPLPAGQPLFVKIKFSEPYLLYRALREITKCVLQKRPVTHFVTMANGLFHGPLPVTRAYAGWITKRIHEDRSSFKGIALGHGIHATRNLFFQWSRTEAGQEALHDEELRWRTEVYSPLPPVANQHWIIVFVGPPGCGKTALSVALAHLFGFKHVQYDKIKAKRKKTVKANFLGMMKMWSAKQVTVLADASSSLRKHRRDIRDAATSTHPVAKVMAFHWALRAVSTDVMSRTLSRRVGLSEDDARKTVDRFVLLHEPLRDAEVDAAVALDYDASLEASLALAIRAVCDRLQLSLPDATEIWEALEIARDPSNHVVKHGSSHETTVPHPTYYALVPQGNLLIAIECYVLTNNPPTSFTTVLERARQNDGSDPLLFRRPHITLVHEAQLHAQDSHALWRLCSAVDTPIRCQVTVKRLIYDDRLIVAPIETLQGDGDTANDFIRHIASSIVQRLHIVVARCRADIQPVEAHALLDAWRGGTSAVKTVFFTQEVTTIARLRGIAGSSNAQKSPCT